jgi:hypothetical protein
VCNAWSFGLPNGRHIRWVCHGRGDYVHELSFELTVNAPMSALPKLRLLARCIARLANLRRGLDRVRQKHVEDHQRLAIVILKTPSAITKFCVERVHPLTLRRFTGTEPGCAGDRGYPR